MNALTTSGELAALLLSKAKEVATGKNLAGTDTLCRCTETVIKLARLEMDFQKLAGIAPKQLSAPTRWTPLDAKSMPDLEESFLRAGLKAGESHLEKIEVEIEEISTEHPKHIGVKVLSAEATYLRVYLRSIRDALGED